MSVYHRRRKAAYVSRHHRGVDDRSGGTKLEAVSDVRVDDYVRSVVSGELPGGWRAAAYQAQAVAARSYALYKQQHASSSSRWDLVDSTADQVYGGYSGETSPESHPATATARAVPVVRREGGVHAVRLGRRRVDVRGQPALPPGQGRPLRRRR